MFYAPPGGYAFKSNIIPTFYASVKDVFFIFRQSDMRYYEKRQKEISSLQKNFIKQSVRIKDDMDRISHIYCGISRLLRRQRNTELSQRGLSPEANRQRA